MPEPTESSLWRPGESTRPGWLAASPAALLLAMDLIRRGRRLSEMPWEKVRGNDRLHIGGRRLDSDGYTPVQRRRCRRCGNQERPGPRLDKGHLAGKAVRPNAGSSPREVRELSAVVEKQRATKGMIVTTSRLTRDAIDWVRQGKNTGWTTEDAERVESWVRTTMLGKK